MNRRGFLKTAILYCASVPVVNCIIPWQQYSKGCVCPCCNSHKVVCENGIFECFACHAEGKLVVRMEICKFPPKYLAKQDAEEKEWFRRFWSTMYPEEYIREL